MSFKSVIGVLFLLTILLIIPVSAADSSAPPIFPMQMTGSAVDANGNPLPAGTVITATVDGITSTYVVKENGKIGEPGTFGEKFLITGLTQSSPITFAVNGVVSEQTVPFGSGIPSVSPTLNFDVVIENTPSGKSYSGSGISGGSSSTIQNPVTPVETKTQTAQPTQTSGLIPVTPIQTQASTPVPFAGIIIGLGVSVFFGLRRN